MFDDSRSFIGRAFLRATSGIGTDACVLAKRRRKGLSRRLSSSTHGGMAKRVGFLPKSIRSFPGFPFLARGQEGGVGEADLALGWFRGREDAIPQVLCEFKDIRSSETLAS
jgi:hypothetical protein